MESWTTTEPLSLWKWSSPSTAALTSLVKSAVLTPTGQNQLASYCVHQSKGRSQADSQTMVASVSLQILNLVHELDTKLTMVSKFTEKLENKVNNIEAV